MRGAYAARLWAAAWLVFLTGCGSQAVMTPVDEKLDRLGRAGDFAYTLEDPAQAAQSYRAALGRARERDDASAIADAGFNLATAELRAGQPAAALRTAQALQAELARRGADDAGLVLVSATALYRLGRVEEADRRAAALILALTAAPASRGAAPVADAARFLRGLIADGRGDAAGLRQAASALSPAADAGDRTELQARILRDPNLAVRAADLRRDALDYRGMARALALAAALTPDPARSADLFLRAGRSAAARNEATQAREWLREAHARAPTAALRADAHRALAELPRAAR